jgi:drug/metabolite transporter (DMT)-like permease
LLAAVLALASSVTWGLADFMGGLQSRRHALLAVLLVSQVVAFALVAIAVLAGADTGHDARATAWAVGGAALGLGALVAFYRALSIGTMSVVAPISATAVAIPVLAGIVFSGERPGALQYAGIALAAGGVVLVARQPPEEDADLRRSDRAAIGLAIVAAIGFGSFFASVDRAEETADAAWVLLVQRSVDVGLLLVACAIARPHVPRAPAALRAIAAIGVFDLLANLLFILATGRGLLSVVGVLGSLYPVVTVILARFVLAERISRTQGAGVVVTLLGVVALAAG